MIRSARADTEGLRMTFGGERRKIPVSVKQILGKATEYRREEIMHLSEVSW